MNPCVSHAPVGVSVCGRSPVAVSRWVVRVSPFRLSAVSAALTAIVAGAPVAVWAQPAAALKEVMVTATRVAQPLTDVLADVSLIDRDTLAQAGASSLGDVLSRLPGIETTRNGGSAANTSLLLRGAETRHTVLLIDGVRVDSQASGGAAWQALPVSQIERIEVLRGPAAAIYGSDAIGGVVQVFMRQGDGAPNPTVGVGVGSHGTRVLQAGISGASGAWDYAANLSRETSTGFNSQPTGNPDKDGYRRTAGSARLGFQVNKDHKLQATYLSSETDSGYDAFNSKVNDRALQDVRTLGLSWQARWSDQWQTRVGVTRGTDHYQTTPSPYTTDTNVNTVLVHSEWTVGNHQMTAALERREDRLQNASTTPVQTHRDQKALALGYGGKFGAHTVQLNVRHDDDSEFGSHSTGSVGYAFALSPAWRATASVGTAFRAPTLYQRFSIYGTPGVQPEEARNLEVGLKYAANGDSASAVAYRNRVTNLITYVSGPGSCINGTGSFPGCYGNTGKATLSGVTLAGGTRVAQVGLTASLDLQNPRDDVTGKRLARRAKQVAKLGADTTIAGWKLGAEAQLRGHRFDDAANKLRLGGYGVLSLSASKVVSPGLTLLMRLDNLNDKDYQTARGYATGGRTAYVGLSWAGR